MVVPPRLSRSRATTSQPSSSICRWRRETKEWLAGRCTRCGQSVLPSAGAGLRPRMTPRSSGTTSPVGRRRPPSGGPLHATRLLRRDPLVAHPARGEAGGVRWPERAAHGEHRRARCRGRGGRAGRSSRRRGRRPRPPGASSAAAGRPDGGVGALLDPRMIERVGLGGVVQRAGVLGRVHAATYAGARRRAVGTLRGEDGVGDAVDEGGGRRRRLDRAGRGRTGATVAESGVSSTRSAATTPPTRRRGVARESGSVPAVEAEHARRHRRGVRVRTPRDSVVEAPEVKSTTASAGRVAVEGLLHDRQHAFHDGGAGGRGHGRAPPRAPGRPARRRGR